MPDKFTAITVRSVVILLSLLAVDRLPGWMENSLAFRGLMARSEAVRRLEKIPAELHNTDLNAEDLDALAAGYYEGLRKDAGPVGMPEERDDMHYRTDFLRYEFHPYVKRSYPAGMRITNSLGMPNPEYGYQKPPHTRRIALFGDSMSVGPYGNSYDSLLEGRLNRTGLTPNTGKFEVLNFAVNGYSVVQTMDVALEKAPKFQPDVYLVAMTGLEFLGRAGWRTHVGRLMVSGTDLKYGYLKGIVSQAGVQSADHLSRIKVKLAPYSLSVMRWALEQIRDRAASEGARMIVVLLAPPIDPRIVATDFDKLHPLVDGLGVPLIDLRDTFLSADLDALQVIPKADIHPNVQGHRIIFENLYAKLRAQPDAWAALVGQKSY